MDAQLTRRGIGRAALAAAVAVPLGAAWRGSAASAAEGPVRLTLPAPTGPHPVGTVALHLVDGSGRELMVSVWYPARDVRRCRPVRWAKPAVVRALLTSAGLPADAAVAPLTAGHEGAPVRPGPLQVVVYSHGAGDHRAGTTVVVQELASRGYVVVTVDHTGDAFSQFPDGRLVVPDSVLYPADYARDIRFVLDRIEDLAAGRNPDAERRTLPAGLAGALDLRRIGMFGWSKGGTATALVMLADPRVRAGLSLDGPMLPAITTDLARPFMLMTAEFPRSRTDGESGVAEFWSHLKGWRLNVEAEGATHWSYGDYQLLTPQLADLMSEEDLRGWIGTLDPHRAARIQQAYPLAFFDLHLRGRGHLLDGPSASFPEVAFVP